jgi:hypothetical protein
MWSGSTRSSRQCRPSPGILRSLLHTKTETNYLKLIERPLRSLRLNFRPCDMWQARLIEASNPRSHLCGNLSKRNLCLNTPVILETCYDPLGKSLVTVRHRVITSAYNVQNESRAVRQPQSPRHSTWQTSASLRNLTERLLQSRGGNYYISRRILAPPMFRLHKHNDLLAQDFAHCPDLSYQRRLAEATCAWSWRLGGIDPAIQECAYTE